jgi:hypothetical protein
MKKLILPLLLCIANHALAMEGSSSNELPRTPKPRNSSALSQIFSRLSSTPNSPRSPRPITPITTPNMRRLIITLGFSWNAGGKEHDAMLTEFTTAVAQQAAPILVSTQLIHSFYQQIARHRKITKHLQKSMPKLKKIISPNATDSISGFFELTKSLLDIPKLQKDQEPDKATRVKNYFIQHLDGWYRYAKSIFVSSKKPVNHQSILEKLKQLFEAKNVKKLTANMARWRIVFEHYRPNPEEWSIYQVTPLFFLMIPHKYKTKVMQQHQLSKRQRLTDSPVSDQRSNNPLSHEELSLGFNLQNLINITKQHDMTDKLEIFFTNIDTDKVNTAYQTFLNGDNQIEKLLDRFFITNKTMSQETIFDKTINRHINRNIWNIYLIGHGAPSTTTPNLTTEQQEIQILKTEKLGKRKSKLQKQLLSVEGEIAELPITSHFAKLLDYLNHSINTNFFMYNSCYSGGNRDIPAYNLKYNKFKTYNYTMACGSPTATTTRWEQPNIQLVLQTNNQQTTIVPKIIFAKQFNEFFSKLETEYIPSPPKITNEWDSDDDEDNNITNMRITSWGNILNYVNPFLTTANLSTESALSYLNNIPLIRTANTNHWSFIQNPNILSLNFKTIGSLQEKHGLKRIVNLKGYRVVVPATPKIPYTLRVDNPVALISFSPGSGSHWIKAVEAENITIHKLMKIVFLPLSDLDDTRLFMVDKLTFQNSLMLESMLANAGISLSDYESDTESDYDDDEEQEEYAPDIPILTIHKVSFLNEEQHPYQPTAKNKYCGLVFKYDDDYFARLYPGGEDFSEDVLQKLTDKQVKDYKKFYSDRKLKITIQTSPNTFSPIKKVIQKQRSRRKKIIAKKLTFKDDDSEIEEIFNNKK